MYPYFIRLRGPWEMSSGDGVPAIVKMPARWDAPNLAEARGLVRFLRKFGAPRELADGEFTWLSFHGFGPAVAASLNDVPLGKFSSSSTFPVTLGIRNRLELDMVPPPDRACWWGDVALEIRRAAWLEAVQLLADGPDRWRVTGTVVGVSAEPLELYVMRGGHQLHYQEILPRPEGQPFLTSFASPNLKEIRVELVNVATVWYSQVFQAPA